MLDGTSAFSPTGNGLCVSRQEQNYTGTGSFRYNSSGSLFSNGNSSNATTRIASYLRREYSSTIQKAQQYLADGDFNKAMSKIESLRQHAQEYASEQGYTLDSEKITTTLNKAGANFDSYVDENSRGSFATGLFNGIPVVGLFFDSYSKSEIQAKLGNEEVKLSDKIKEGVGKTISGALTGLILSGGNPFGAIAGAGIAFGQNYVKDWINEQ